MFDYCGAESRISNSSLTLIVVLIVGVVQGVTHEIICSRQQGPIINGSKRVVSVRLVSGCNSICLTSEIDFQFARCKLATPKPPWKTYIVNLRHSVVQILVNNRKEVGMSK